MLVLCKQVLNISVNINLMIEKEGFWHQKVDRRKFIIGAAATTALVATGADWLGKAKTEKPIEEISKKNTEVKKQLSPEEKEKKEFREKLARMSKSMVETQEDIILKTNNFDDLKKIHHKINTDYLETIKTYAKEYGIDWWMLRGLIFIESKGEDNVESEAGALGLVQLMPETARDCGLEVNEKKDERTIAEKSIEAACKFLKRYRIEFGSSNLAIVTYHMGAGNMNRLIRMYLSPKEVKGHISDMVKKENLTYTEIFFNNHKTKKNPGTYRILFEELKNESEIYYWKIVAATHILNKMDKDLDIIKEKSDILFDMDDKKFRKYVENKWHKNDCEQIGKITNL